jgi:hypothetical protein
MKPKYDDTQNFQDDCTAQTQVCSIFHHDGSNPYHLHRVQHLLPGVIHKPCKTVRGYKFCLDILLMGGSIYYGWYYKHKEFTLLGTGKSTQGNTVPLSTAIFSACVVWSIKQYIHCTACYQVKVNSSVL